MNLYEYHVTLKHSAGHVTLSVIADRMSKAVSETLRRELAPFRSITRIKRVRVIYRGLGK